MPLLGAGVTVLDFKKVGQSQHGGIPWELAYWKISFILLFIFSIVGERYL